MPDRPYTDEDLRAAAALMHYALTIAPNPADADSVLSGHAAWVHVEVGSDDEDQLRESVVELVSSAANTSEWAVDLGADGLQPDEHQITLGAGKPIARIHFAFEPDMPDEMRTSLVEGIGEAIADVL